ncbi:MAG: outer membrane lipoprotein-sorting protein [Nannocystaceae bacterium]|nr:outer membrane lipoprotein-sorting protein [Myxococcales bacterium]
MKPITILLAAALLTPAIAVVHPASVAAADAKALGAKVLEKIDQDAARHESVSYTAEMELWKSGSKQKTLQFNMSMKGLHKQYIEFTAPGDVAGMKILMTDADTIHMYSPEFKKVRHVAAHAEKQGFLGSEFTPEDMAMAALSDRFDAELQGKVGTETTLILTPKQGVESSYTRLEVVIDSSKGGVTKLKYYDGSGTAVREQLRGGWTKLDGVPFPTEIRMKNLKTGNETVIKLSNVDATTELPDSLFSRRTLLRG